jgi:predicted RNase H-like HicB family nuclease
MGNTVRYPVVLYHSDEGVAVGCPVLPGCWSQGETEEEALENIAIAIQEYLEVVQERAERGEMREVEVPV